jgi:hypothetical protein
VLLAPACSSFDQFHDYEERGRVFKDLVNRLAEDAALGKVVRTRGTGTLREELPVASPETKEPRWEPETTIPESSAPDSKDAVFAVEDDTRARMEAQLVESPPAQNGPGPADFDSQMETIGPDAPVEESGPAAIAGGDTNVEAVPTASSTAEPEIQSVVAERVVEDPVTGEVTGEDAISSLEAEAQAEERGANVSSTLEEPATPQFAAVIPKHFELRYVYEVDAMEMPSTEAALQADDHPEVYVLAGPPEVAVDEMMPFEVRPPGRRQSKPRSSKSGPHTGKKDAAPTVKQPKLFEKTD